MENSLPNSYQMMKPHEISPLEASDFPSSFNAKEDHLLNELSPEQVCFCLII